MLSIVGIGYDQIVDGSYEGGVTFDSKSDGPLLYAAGIGLKRCCQMRLRIVSREDESEMPDILSLDADLELRVQNRIRESFVANFR